MSKKILITGASSGLGEGMARHFASRGHSLALAARREDRLNELAAELRELGAPVVATARLDVTDYDTVPGTLASLRDELDGLDIVVANSGVAAGARVGKGGFADARRTIETNLIGAIATIEAAVEIFREQGHGQIVGISSVAAVRGMPGQGAYSASKSGLSRYLEALCAEVANEQIVVTDLAPGFIDTDLNRSLKSRPFLVSGEEGTRQMADLIEKGVSFSYVPAWPWTLVAQGLKVAPNKMLGR
ncbi:MAG: NADP-dependent 3-hydroxy acid dehydrogenase YdfG [Hyphomicrobiaceae bacterium]|jgi:NADP-dependent 3-hydroxy acid dehydrogenase YdfG